MNIDIYASTYVGTYRKTGYPPPANVDNKYTNKIVHKKVSQFNNLAFISCSMKNEQHNLASAAMHSIWDTFQ